MYWGQFLLIVFRRPFEFDGVDNILQQSYFLPQYHHIPRQLDCRDMLKIRSDHFVWKWIEIAKELDKGNMNSYQCLNLAEKII